jgi:hypothetical protein
MRHSIQDRQMKKQKEKRKSRRYIPEKETYIFFSPGITKKGPVINISRTGLSCIYYIHKSDHPKFIENKANICFRNFFLGSINYRIISDEPVTDDYNDSDDNGDDSRQDNYMNQVCVRKRTISFENLTYSQFIQLDFFINNYTEKFFPMLIKRCKNFINATFNQKSKYIIN